MVSDIYETNLVKTLIKADLDFLIPACPTSYDDDEEVGHVNPDSDYIGYDNDPYYAYEEAEEDDEEDLNNYDARIHNMDELMLAFDCDTIEPEEFLEKNAWDLFGLTLPQLKMVKTEYLDLGNFRKFNRVLNRNKKLSVEQRIKWATVCAVTDCDQNSEEVADHCRHISDIYDEKKAIYTIGLYCDYVRFFHHALIMNERRKENGGPVFDYVLCPKPSHIKDLHDKAFRDYNTIEAEIAAAEKKKLDERIRSSAENPIYKRFLYGDDKFEIIAPKDYDDFEREGKELNHCIASYAKNFADLTSFIYFLREKDKIDKPFYSMEVLPDFNTNKFVLKQCYTYDDTTVKTPECREFINKWCKKFGIRKGCEV